MKGHREVSGEIRNSWHSYLDGIYRVYQSTDSLFYAFTVSMLSHSLSLNSKKKKSFQVSVLTLKAEGWRACPSRSMWIFSIVCGLGMLGKGGVTGTVFFLVLSTGDS